jgi:hypothetical protein
VLETVLSLPNLNLSLSLSEFSTAALLWQMMRAHIFSLLSKLNRDRRLSEEDMIQWANQKVHLSLSPLHLSVHV